MEYSMKMKIEKYHVGIILAIICVAILVADFFLPWWVIERDERTPTANPEMYVDGSHEFKLLSLSTTMHREDIVSEPLDERFETSYSDIYGSELDTHFMVLTILMIVGMTLTVALLLSYHLSRVKGKLRLIGVILGFAVIFVILGSAAYLHQNVPSEVGNSRTSIEEALGYGYVVPLPEIRTFAGTDFNQTTQWTSETIWGPSFAWYSTFAVCIMMIISIVLLETRAKKEKASVDP